MMLKADPLCHYFSDVGKMFIRRLMKKRRLLLNVRVRDGASLQRDREGMSGMWKTHLSDRDNHLSYNTHTSEYTNGPASKHCTGLQYGLDWNLNNGSSGLEWNH